MINNPFYRKNSDSETRHLERELSAEYDETVLTALCAVHVRAHRVKELLALDAKYPGNTIIADALDKCKPWVDYTQKPKFRILRGHTAEVTCCNYSPDGSQIVSGSNDGTLKIWDANTGKIIRTLRGHTGQVTCCRYSPDGLRIVSGSDNGALRIWDVNSGLSIRKIRTYRWKVNCCDYSPDGSRIVVGFESGGLEVFKANLEHCPAPAEIELLSDTGFELHSMRFTLDFRRTVTCCRYSPDGSQIVVGAGRNLTILDANTGDSIRMLDTTARPILPIDKLYKIRGEPTCCCYSPDGSRIAYVTDKGPLRIWNTKTRKIRVLRIQEFITSCDFSPDGSSIVTASNYLSICDTNTGKEIKILRDRDEDLSTKNCCEFSPDGSQIVSGSDDGTLKVRSFPVSWKPSF